MDSQFAHLRQRDTSVSMLRVKMSRRRSQSQKENRERVVNTRRQLAKLQEMEMSCLEASMAMANMSTIQEKTVNNAKSAKNVAGEERLKQLERWKERKALEKEKEKREKERKGVFKTGIYHPNDTLISRPAVPTKAKETKVNMVPPQSTRVTRSMKQQHQVQRPLKIQDPNTVAKKAQPAVERSTRSRAAPVKPAPAPAVSKAKVCAVEPVIRASRSANRPPVTAAPVVKDKPKVQEAASGLRTTRSRALINHVAPSLDPEMNRQAAVKPAVAKMQEPEEKPRPSSLSASSEEEDMEVTKASDPAVDPVEEPSSLSSFAPKGFIFKAPTGLSLFKFEPLTPRSADAFLTPSPNFAVPEVPAFNIEPQAELSEPSPPKSPRRSPPQASLTVAPSPPGSPLESKHDVPYFRLEIANETERLTTLCVHWEPKVEDESIPEEMRDRMRTAVGQARLLMKERFKQFAGLVDDCELGRGEKITTCTDLQGFWDMVYYQVEDVNKKFNALKEAESRDWVEEQKPQPTRQRKVVKKPSAAPAKPAGTKAAAAKSRLAAVKATMKAKQQAAEAEKAAEAAGEEVNQNPQEPSAQAEPEVVFDGGFFQVASPARASGPVRRSNRLSAAVQPQASPCSSYLSPLRVTRRSLALAQTPLHLAASPAPPVHSPAPRVHSPAKPVHTPAHFRLTLEQTPAQVRRSQRGTPQRKDNVNASLCFSPVKEALPEDNAQSETQENAPPVSELSTATPVRSPPIVNVEEKDKPAESIEVDLHLSPCNAPLVSQAPESSSSLSFLLTPCVTPSQTPISTPAVAALKSVCDTPESSIVEEIPGLDFERYLQPSLRSSLSPRATQSPMATPSPMAVDVEMESPRGQPEDLLTQHAPAVPSLLTLQSPQVQAADSALLLFTPDPMDRIRQSVCPSDLMVFTPPL